MGPGVAGELAAESPLGFLPQSGGAWCGEPFFLVFGGAGREQLGGDGDISGMKGLARVPQNEKATRVFRSVYCGSMERMRTGGHPYPQFAAPAVSWRDCMRAGLCRV